LGGEAGLTALRWLGCGLDKTLKSEPSSHLVPLRRAGHASISAKLGDLEAN
jgi:hypothetical protein